MFDIAETSDVSLKSWVNSYWLLMIRILMLIAWTNVSTWRHYL